MTRARFIVTLLATLVLGTSAVQGQQKGVDVTGKWVFAVITENGTGYPTVVLKQDGEKVTGTYDSPRMGTRPLEGTIKGDTIRLEMKGGTEGMPAFMFVGVMVDKDNMKGELEMGGMGSAPFTGKRES